MKYLLLQKSLEVLTLTLLMSSCIPNQQSIADQPSEIAPASEPTPSEQPRQIGQTPQELGSEYPELVRQARQAVSALSLNKPVKFPLGVNFPIRMSDNSSEELSQERRYEAIGYVTSSGEPRAFTPPEIIEIIDVHLNSIDDGSSSSLLITKPVLVTDASGTSVPTPSEQVSVLDLIVLDIQNGRINLVPNVVFAGVLRDTINAALNGELVSTKTDVTQIDLNEALNQVPRQ